MSRAILFCVKCFATTCAHPNSRCLRRVFVYFLFFILYFFTFLFRPPFLFIYSWNSFGWCRGCRWSVHLDWILFDGFTRNCSGKGRPGKSLTSRPEVEFLTDILRVGRRSQVSVPSLMRTQNKIFCTLRNIAFSFSFLSFFFNETHNGNKISNIIEMLDVVAKHPKTTSVT